MINETNGTPCAAYVSLTNGAIGPTAVQFFPTMGQAARTLQPGERFYIASVQISSSDTASALVTLDSGGASPTKFVSSYLGAGQQLAPFRVAPGMMRGIFGVAPRLTATAVTAGKTIECSLTGFISRT